MLHRLIVLLVRGVRWFPVLVPFSLLAAAPLTVTELSAFRTAHGLSARPEGIGAGEWDRLVQSGAALEARLEELRLRGDATGRPVPPDLLADAGALWRNALWLFRYEEQLTPEDPGRVERALNEGLARASELAAGSASWTRRHGRLLRGFVSAIDGSHQPYGLVVPSDYDPARPMRLDVVLHGSVRPRGGAALRVGHRFLAPEPAAGPEAATGFIELHPLGRVENGYRWAGEADIFEAIEAVCRQYAIDRSRIVLRGFSMGASGTWHVGLKHPDRFAALGPYCGYVDTHRFSASPNPRFVRVVDLPPHQEAALRLNDAIGYAANAGVVPVVAAIGELDPGFVNHTYMEAAFAAEGLQLVNLIAPGTAHRIHPETQAEQLRRIEAHLADRPGGAPRALRFVTWSLKYARCHWLELRQLERHYERAEVAANLGDDGVLRVTALRNIARFTIDLERLGVPVAGLEVLGVPITLLPAARSVELVRDAAGWRGDEQASAPRVPRKQPGLQGPIDDAFTAPFLCVRGTGTPWHPEVGAWADAALRRFAHEWARYMGGDLPVKNDTEVTPEDLRTRHLVLFGDPGSNRWIREALPGLPLEWTRETVGIRERASAATHAPVLVCASPLPGAQGRYLVLNSGHTFHEAEFSTLNYLLFPRLGDWALVQVPPGAAEWRPGAPAFPEHVIAAGFFDEYWRP
jgi:dienelactone hydrolase